MHNLSLSVLPRLTIINRSRKCLGKLEDSFGREKKTIIASRNEGLSVEFENGDASVIRPLASLPRRVMDDPQVSVKVELDGETVLLGFAFGGELLLPAPCKSSTRSSRSVIN